MHLNEILILVIDEYCPDSRYAGIECLAHTIRESSSWNSALGLPANLHAPTKPFCENSNRRFALVVTPYIRSA